MRRARTNPDRRARRERDDFDESLALLVRLRREQPSDAAVLVRPLLTHASAYLASEAATVCGELQLSSLAPELVALFQRAHDGAQADRGRAIARSAIGALRSLGARARDTYLLAIQLVSQERTSDGGVVDMAIPVRIGGAAALVETEGEDALFDVLPLLGDDQPEVRAGAAKAIGALQTTAAASALLVKLISGDSNADVSGACLSGLLMVDTERFAPLVKTYLTRDDDDLASLAAIALAEARAPETLEALRRAVETHRAARRGRALCVAIAILRGEESERCLFQYLEKAPEKLAESALYALAIHRDRTGLVDEVRRIVKARKSRDLQRQFERTFLES